MTHTTIGIIGCGYWGPNLLRNFAESETAELRWICDVDSARLSAISRRYPGARTTIDFHDLITDPRTGQKFDPALQTCVMLA